MTRVDAPLLHLVTPARWRDALAAQAVHPTVAPFVHLSTPEQVARPANRLHAGERDLSLLVIDPTRIGVDVRWEPGVAADPDSMLFPHAYGPVPTAAVLAVVPYRPAGTFTTPVLPALDAAGRVASFAASVLRRVATSETPVAGGVAIRTDLAPDSHTHNTLLVSGPSDAATVEADADRTLAGLGHRCVTLLGDAHAATAAALAARGWSVGAFVHMAAPPVAVTALPAVEELDRAALRPLWDASWRRDLPGVTDDVVEQLGERYAAEEHVVDLRYLGIREGATVVACALLKIDGATAALDAVQIDPEHRGRGHGDALLGAALARAARAGCDLVGLAAEARDRPRGRYRRRGFTEVARSWVAARRLR